MDILKEWQIYRDFKTQLDILLNDKLNFVSNCLFYTLATDKSITDKFQPIIQLYIPLTTILGKSQRTKHQSQAP